MKMSSKKEAMMNDSESEDEDYVPPEADEDEPSGIILATDLSSTSAPILSSTKQKSVDDAFQDLFGKPYVATTNTQKKRPKSKKALKKKKILSDIFAPGIASELIASSGDFVKSDSEFRKRKGALKQLATEMKKEQVKFAGQMIEVERTVVGGENKEQQMAGSASAGSAAKPMGIDSVLSQIKGPQKVTTIDKTNIDWETFKDKTGLEEELKKKAEGKDAYLVKKDFLNRVDARKFEQEKDERSRKRAATAYNAK
jgi:hypothetical protein